MKKYALILFISFLFFENIYGQKIGERISMSILAGPLVESGSENPLSLNLSIHTQIKLNSVFRLGLIYENGLFDFGTNYSQSFNSLEYTEEESFTARLKRISLVPIIDLSDTRVATFFGIGLSYASQPGQITRAYFFDGSLLSINFSEPYNRMARTFLLGAKSGRWSIGGSIHAEFGGNGNTYTSIWTGYEFMSAKPSKHYVAGKNRYLKMLLFEVGTKWNVPFRKKYAATNTVYFSPKIFISKSLSLGVQLEGEMLDFGNDADFETYLINDFRGNTIHQARRLDRMSRVNMVSIFADKYFRGKNHWYFFGGGINLATVDGVNGFSGINEKGEIIEVAPISKIETVGLHARAGIKAGAIRPSLAMNAGLENVPLYISFRLGFEFGLIKMKR